MAKSRRATIKDVARAAGVAPGTVSNVLNNTAPVSREARGRVLAAAAALGYRRNLVAASMRRNATHTIGLILPNINNPLYSDTVSQPKVRMGVVGNASLARGYGPEGSTAVPQSCLADRAGDP